MPDTQTHFAASAPLISGVTIAMLNHLLERNFAKDYDQLRPYGKTLTPYIEDLEDFLSSGERFDPTLVELFVASWRDAVTAWGASTRGKTWYDRPVTLARIERTFRYVLNALVGPDEAVCCALYDEGVDALPDEKDRYASVTHFFVFLVHHINKTLPDATRLEV